MHLRSLLPLGYDADRLAAVASKLKGFVFAANETTTSRENQSILIRKKNTETAHSMTFYHTMLREKMGKVDLFESTQIFVFIGHHERSILQYKIFKH